jgi:hypothetical protein
MRGKGSSGGGCLVQEAERLFRQQQLAAATQATAKDQVSHSKQQETSQ